MAAPTAPRTVAAYGQHEVIGTGWMWLVWWDGVWQPEVQSWPSLSWTTSLGSCFCPGPSWAGSRNESMGWRAVSLPPSDRWVPLPRRKTASFKKQGYFPPRHSQPSFLQITFSCLAETLHCQPFNSPQTSLLTFIQGPLILGISSNKLLAVTPWTSHTPSLHREFWYSWPISRGLLWPWDHFQPFMDS